MGVSILGKTVYRGDVKDAIEQLEKKVPRLLIAEVSKMKVRITRDHVDVNERSFKPYTERYARRKGVPRNAVDMTLTGQMLRSITVRGGRRSDNVAYDIVFSDSKSQAKAEGNIKRGRKFFGFTKKQWESIREALARIIKG